MRAQPWRFRGQRLPPSVQSHGRRVLHWSLPTSACVLLDAEALRISAAFYRALVGFLRGLRRTGLSCRLVGVSDWGPRNASDSVTLERVVARKPNACLHISLSQATILLGPYIPCPVNTAIPIFFILSLVRYHVGERFLRERRQGRLELPRVERHPGRSEGELQYHPLWLFFPCLADDINSCQLQATDSHKMFLDLPRWFACRGLVSSLVTHSRNVGWPKAGAAPGGLRWQ